MSEPLINDDNRKHLSVTLMPLQMAIKKRLKDINGIDRVKHIYGSSGLRFVAYPKAGRAYYLYVNYRDIYQDIFNRGNSVDDYINESIAYIVSDIDE